MNKPTRRLGRGLDSLIPKLPPGIAIENEIPTGETSVQYPRIDTEQRHGLSSTRAAMLHPSELSPNPFQPRVNIGEQEILSLAHSIRTSGFIQPIAVRQAAGGYEIIAGERRWRAAKSLGMKEVPVMIRQATDEQMLELALVENIQREDLNPIDRAKAYRDFCDRFQQSPEKVGERLGEDRTTVVNYLRLLDLPPKIREMLVSRQLGMGHARCLLGIQDSSQQHRLAEAAVRNELSVRAMEEIARRERGATASSASPMPGAPVGRLRSPHLKDMERRFEQAAKTKVTIQEGKRRGTGRIIIEYYSLADFERLAGLMSVELE